MLLGKRGGCWKMDLDLGGYIKIVDTLKAQCFAVLWVQWLHPYVNVIHFLEILPCPLQPRTTLFRI